MEIGSIVRTCVFVGDVVSAEFANQLSQFGIQKVQNPPLKGYYLYFHQGALALKSEHGFSINIDFTSIKYQRKFNPSSDLLCRACGWHLGLRSLWDLTAGWGVDAVILARAGFSVNSLERNKLLAFLLLRAMDDWAVSTSYQQDCRGSLKFDFWEAGKFLRDSLSPLPEVIYYDPMYPAKAKTALPSKEMQILRELNGTNEEDPEILLFALKKATKRVVVKRPLKAPPLLEKPKIQLYGKLVRFDIYLPTMEACK